MAAGMSTLVELLYDEMPQVLIAQSEYDARHPHTS
jgi:hypothetical protein